MTVQEVLEKAMRQIAVDQLAEGFSVITLGYNEALAEGLAPIIKRALRAAWERGYEDCLGHETGEGDLGHADNGVTAGVAAMMEES